jgi:hypothetical protein
MAAPLDDVCCACLPAAALAALGGLRVHPGVRVKLDAGRAWLFWAPGDESVLRAVLPLHGAEVFARRGGAWYRPGQHLPAFDVPTEDGAQALLHALSPSPVHPEGIAVPAFDRLRVGLVRDDRPRPATALYCPLSELARWADQATSQQLASLQGVYCEGHVLVRGGRLPALARVVGAGSPRPYWGRAVLIPLGYRAEPDVAEGVLGEVLGLQAGETALLSAGGAEVIPADLFRPLTRSGVRLAVREKA